MREDLGGIEIGDSVCVEWLDHVAHAGWHEVSGTRYELMRFHTFGVLLEEHADRIVVASTAAVQSTADDRTIGDVHVLVMGAIISVVRLEPVTIDTPARSTGNGETEG